MRRALRWRDAFVVAFGLAVAICTYSAFQAQRRTEPIVVAARPIAAHSVLGPGDVKIVAWPAVAVAASMVRVPQAVVGGYTLQTFVAGEPVLSTLVSGDDRDLGLRGALPPGHSAVAVPVDDEAQLPPVSVGDRVDLIYTSSHDRGAAIARSLLRGVQVVGVDSERGSLVGSAETRALYVAVTASDAERIAYALANGHLWIALDGFRPDGARTFGVDAATLFTEEAYGDVQ